MFYRVKSILSLLICLFLAACSGSVEAPAEELDPPTGISGTSWIVTTLDDGTGNLIDVLEGTEITAHFHDETQGGGYLTGFSGCNEYEAYYTLYEEDQISIIPNWQNAMKNECSESVMAQEEAYLWGNIVRKWVLNKYVLELTDDDDNFLISMRYIGPFEESVGDNG